MTATGSKIGLFDSGLGGLTILKSVASVLPQYDYLFYGDTEHLPLGDKTEQEIFEYTKAGVEELFKQDAAIVIIACNTAAAETMRRLQDGFLPENYPNRRILGVIIPTVEELVNSRVGDALLIATKRTVESKKYERELEKVGSDIKLRSLATPELVPLIETGKSHEASKLAEEIIKSAIKSGGETDTVILGCTHYAKFKNELRQALGTEIKVLSQDEIIPDKLKQYLDNHPEIESKLSRNGTRSIKLSLHREDYDHIIADLLEGAMI